MSEGAPQCDHLSWVIRGRAATQSTSLRLYSILKEADSTKLERLRWQAHDLVAISFSLWRAVFLADKSGQPETTDQHAIVFMEKMLIDNSITFTQDRLSREWSFNYYAGNARYRLGKLGREWASVAEKLSQEKRRPPSLWWDTLQTAFEEGVVCLGRSMSLPN